MSVTDDDIHFHDALNSRDLRPIEQGIRHSDLTEQRAIVPLSHVSNGCYLYSRRPIRKTDEQEMKIWHSNAERMGMSYDEYLSSSYSTEEPHFSTFRALGLQLYRMEDHNKHHLHNIYGREHLMPETPALLAFDYVWQNRFQLPRVGYQITQGFTTRDPTSGEYIVMAMYIKLHELLCDQGDSCNDVLHPEHSVVAGVSGNLGAEVDSTNQLDQSRVADRLLSVNGDDPLPSPNLSFLHQPDFSVSLSSGANLSPVEYKTVEEMMTPTDIFGFVRDETEVDIVGMPSSKRVKMSKMN